MLANSATGLIAPKRGPMGAYRTVALVGMGLLIAGFVFLAKDSNSFDLWSWILGPIMWMMGSTLMIATSLGYLVNVMGHHHC